MLKEIGAVRQQLQKAEGKDIDIQELVATCMYSSAYIYPNLPSQARESER
jgi:ABC-type molybdenum transport system ATPase subunit/photorepair protein PhrA